MLEEIEKKYTIKEDGRVWSNYKKDYKKFSLSNSGYLCTSIWIKGKECKLFQHRLVAMKYIPNPDRKTQVNHKNGIKTDNRIENLEWCTASENSQHSYDNGFSSVHKNSVEGLRKTMSKKVIDTSTGLTYRSAKEVSDKFNISHSTLRCWLNGSRTNYSTFKYINY